MNEDDVRKWKPLAGPFNQYENWMMRNVISDLERGGIEYRIRMTPEGTEIWRDPKGWLGE